MSFVGRLHERHVYSGRLQALTNELAAVLPQGSSVLDVGCGDGLLDRALLDRRPDLSIRGIDVLIRPKTYIEVSPFDGVHLPAPDDSADVVMFVDVIHHINDPRPLLREAVRVARRFVVIKDHLREGFLAGPTLRLMDWVGNAHHGVHLPYNYWREEQWRSVFAELGLEAREFRDRIVLYPPLLNALFGRRLHFVARLEVASAG